MNVTKKGAKKLGDKVRDGCTALSAGLQIFHYKSSKYLTLFLYMYKVAAYRNSDENGLITKQMDPLAPTSPPRFHP